MADAGLTATEGGGLSTTVALDDLVGSARLVAVTMTFCGVATFAGAVYRPAAESVPIAGLIVHVTAVLLLHATLPANCCVPRGESVALCGTMATDTEGFTTTVPVADLVGSAALAAVTVTVSCEWTEDGAV